MPLKIVRFDLRRMLSVIPLGFKMLIKGKVPNPFAPPIPGIGQVRAIFNALGRATRLPGRNHP